MIIFRYIFIFSFISSLGFSSQEDLEGLLAKRINRNPSDDDSAYESNSTSGAQTPPLTPPASHDLFADIAAPVRVMPPLLPGQKMEEDTIIEMVNSFIERSGGVDDEKRKTLVAIKELAQQKRGLIGLMKAYKKRNKGISVGHLFDDLIDQVRKNEDSYHDAKEAILKELSKHNALLAPNTKTIDENTYKLEEKCRNTVVKIAAHAQRTSPYDPTYKRLQDRRKLISNNRMLGILQIL